MKAKILMVKKEKLVNSRGFSIQEINIKLRCRTNSDNRTYLVASTGHTWTELRNVSDIERILVVAQVKLAKKMQVDCWVTLR